MENDATAKNLRLFYFLAIVPFFPISNAAYDMQLWTNICIGSRILVLLYGIYSTVVRKKFSVPLALAVIYFLGCFISTFLAHVSFTPIANAGVYLFGLTLLIEDGVARDVDAMTEGMLLYFEIIIYANLVYFLMNPVGARARYGSMASYCHLLDNHNSVIRKVFPGIVLGTIHAFRTKKGITLRLACMWLAVAFYLLRVRSMTALMGMLIFASAILWHSFIERSGIFKYEYFIVLSAWISIQFAVLRKFSFAHGFITKILGKKITISGRTRIWARAAKRICQRPFLGYGQLKASRALKLIGGAHAHNMLLGTLFFGGILGLIILIVMLVVYGRKIYSDRKKGSRLVFIFDACFCACFVMWNFETFALIGEFAKFYMLFVMAYYCEKFEVGEQLPPIPAEKKSLRNFIKIDAERAPKTLNESSVKNNSGGKSSMPSPEKSLIKSTNNVEKSLRDCLKKTENEDKSAEFQKLVDTCGAIDVICALAERRWDDTGSLAEELRGVAFFDHIKRPRGKKLTIAAHYCRIRNGGADRVVAQLCNLWSSMKDAGGEPLYRVILITDGAPEEDEYPLDKNVERAFLPPFRRSQKKNYRARAEAWEKILSEYSIDVVVYGMWISECCFWDMLCVKGHKTKPAFLIHSHGFCGMPFCFSDDTAFNLAMQYRLCDGVVVLSECDERYVSVFCPNTKYIPDMLTFSVKDTPISSREKNTLLWCGRIASEKQPLDAVRMMEIVVREIPDAKFFIVGDGSKKISAQLRDLTAKLHLEKNVIFKGFTTDVAKYYRTASVFIGTSSYEGFWLTLGEAMSCGIPIVTYDLPWLTFMQDGRGIVTVPQKRYDLLAREVVSLLRDPERAKKIGERGRAQAEELETTDIGAAWKEMFDHIGETMTPRLDPNEKILYESLCRFHHEGRKKLFRGIRDAFAFTLRKNWQNVQRSLNHNFLYPVKKFFSHR